MSQGESLSEPSRPASTDILSNEQIERLLHDAEVRLSAASAASSQLQKAPEDQDTIEMETVARRKPLPRPTNSLKQASYIKQKDGIARADERRLVEKHRTLSSILKEAEADQVLKARQKKDEKPSSGPDWFDLPKTIMTSQLKRDLQIIEMRSVLDPHRHYKKNSSKGRVPAFSQTGTVIEGPAEWYSSRINKKDRANNFVEEVLATEKETGRFKRKYEEIQTKKASGKKAYYKGLVEKRRQRR